MDNRFENKGKDQNVGIGDEAIGKQVNITQQVDGNNNLVTGTGDIHVHSSAPPVIPRQLPYFDACFLGRDKELAELVKQLHPGKVVAVCGPGGMGKSALAAQAVHKIEEDRFPDGIVFHSFYHQASTDMALQTICQAFQVEAKTGLAIAVQTVLAGKKALLTLDGAEEAEDLKAVLDLRSTCGVLITSRKRSDAQKHRLDLKPLENKQAVDVFCEYSGAEADDESVQGICEILDGWPVGLRIAGRYLSSTGESAAEYLRWLKKEPFKELADDEHQEENAALLLRRSVEQVSEDARLALSVAGTLAFAPIMREPVEAILNDVRRGRIALNELVNYGLMEKRGERWQISHSLIYSYARTKLPLDRDIIIQLSSRYFIFCLHLISADAKGYSCLDSERTHYLKLMEVCLHNELWLAVQILEGILSEYFDFQAWWTERLIALSMRLKAARQAGDQKDEALCLNNIGYTYHQRGEYINAVDFYKQSLSIRRNIGDRQGEGAVQNNIGSIYRKQGKNEQALRIYEKSLSIARKAKDLYGKATALNNIGEIYRIQNDLALALKYYRQSLAINRKIGNRAGESAALNNIAEIYREKKMLTKALKCHKHALKIVSEIGNLSGQARACWNIGLTYKEIGELAETEKYIGYAVQIAKSIEELPLFEEWRCALEDVRAVRKGMG
uniref:tetratricopeptide repeat protein n=1 Tax=Candidatus Electrothrix sp. TaxID=2170559 RepID=UPI004056800D